MAGVPEQSDAAVLVEAHGPVRLVTLNRPAALNAADAFLHGSLATIWRSLDADRDVRAIVLTGAGSAFSAGGDLDLLEKMTEDRSLRSDIMAEAAEIVRSMIAVRVPIVAAVNGPAVGLGCSLASMCDVVIIEEHAYFSDPHVALGLVAADGAVFTWPLLTSMLRAKEYILLGERISADAAVQLGLANRVVSTGRSVEDALALGQRLSELPPQAVRGTKTILNNALAHAVQQNLALALEMETESFDQAEFRRNLESMRSLSRRREKLGDR